MGEGWISAVAVIGLFRKRTGCFETLDLWPLCLRTRFFVTVSMTDHDALIVNYIKQHAPSDPVNHRLTMYSTFWQDSMCAHTCMPAGRPGARHLENYRHQQQLAQGCTTPNLGQVAATNLILRGHKPCNLTFDTLAAPSRPPARVEARCCSPGRDAMIMIATKHCFALLAAEIRCQTRRARSMLPSKRYGNGVCELHASRNPSTVGSSASSNTSNNSVQKCRKGHDTASQYGPHMSTLEGRCGTSVYSLKAAA